MRAGVYVWFHTNKGKILKEFGASLSKREMRDKIEYSKRCADSGICKRCRDVRDGIVELIELSFT